MSRKPPQYMLDPETKRIAEVVIEFAQELAHVQHSVEAERGILDLTKELAVRLGLEPHAPKSKRLCEVIPLRPFRVVKPDNEEN